MDKELCYESRNNSCVKTVHPLSIRITLYILLGAAAILTMLGNLLVIFAISYFKQLQTPTNYLTLSLAVSDFLLGGVVMLPSMIRSVETCWYLGELFCIFHASFDFVLCTASILNLSFIAIDRYYAICHPLLYRSKITVHSVIIMILVSWSVSAIAGFGLIFIGLMLGSEELYYSHDACEGECILIMGKTSSILASFLSFYIPGIIMLCIYLKIYLVAKKQARIIHNTSSVASAKVADKSQRKATKTLAIIMGVFLAFWLPFFICNIINPYINFSIPPVLFETFSWLGYLNSTVNPLVYALFYSWFRKAFIDIISGNVFKFGISEIKLFNE